MFITKVETPFWKYVSGVIKSYDGKIPAGTVFSISIKVTQNNKEYGIIDGNLDLPGWDTTKDYGVLMSAVTEYTEPTPPNPSSIFVNIGKGQFTMEYDENGETVTRHFHNREAFYLDEDVG